MPELLHPVRHVRYEARSHGRSVVRAFRSPGRERDTLVQIMKSAGAAVVAWQLAVTLLHSQQPFLAPLAALITVHATVYRSVRGALQLVVAVLAGVFLAFLVARAFGVSAWSLGLVLVAALLLARWRRLGDEGLQVPVTALLAMTIAGGLRDTALEARFVETAIGAVIGAGVNSFVFPPVHLRDARQAVAASAGAVARLLRAVGDGVSGPWDEDTAAEWAERAKRIDRFIAEARATVEHGLESMRLNPRRRDHGMPDGADLWSLTSAIDSLEHVAIRCRSITSTLRESAASGASSRVLPGFLRHYAVILSRMADAFDALADRRSGDQEVEDVRSAVASGGHAWRELRSLIASGKVQYGESLPAYGSLLIDAERILDELERAEGDLAVSTP
jgi:uncharacterized membrane protein YccC